MLCQICKKNEAAVRYTEIVDSSVTEMDICRKCAEMEDKGSGGEAGFTSAFASVQEKPEVASILEEDVAAKCPCCGGSFRHILSDGRLGCAECYVAFRDRLAPVVEKTHGASRHIGKVASRKRDALPVRNRLLRYRSQLRKAIEAENYEEAANLRDLIRAVEEEMINN